MITSDHQGAVGCRQAEPAALRPGRGRWCPQPSAPAGGAGARPSAPAGGAGARPSAGAASQSQAEQAGRKPHVQPAEHSMAQGETRTGKLSEGTAPEPEDSHDQRSSDGGQSPPGGGGHGEGADEAHSVAGWAEAMAKILGKKPTESSSSILVKSKELDKLKAAEREEQLRRRQQMDRKRTWERMSREKPDPAKEREVEKALQRTATRGVVQLFNAVRRHQKTVDDKVKAVGGSERKKAKILSSFSKKDFISVLRREEGVGKTPTTKEDIAPAVQEEPAWRVLTDDFMMEASMKDWDKDSDGGEEGGPSGGSDSD
ncbi:RRP15-like protein [Menidia menidia]